MSPLSQPHSWCVPQVPCRRLHHDSQFKVSTGQTSARYAGKCLTDSLRKKKKKSPNSSIWQFLWYKYSYHGQFQTTNFMALKAESGRDAPKGLSQAVQTSPSMLPGRTDLRYPPEKVS